jgi:hypothetical protein
VYDSSAAYFLFFFSGSEETEWRAELAVDEEEERGAEFEAELELKDEREGKEERGAPGGAARCR